MEADVESDVESVEMAAIDEVLQEVDEESVTPFEVVEDEISETTAEAEEDGAYGDGDSRC